LVSTATPFKQSFFHGTRADLKPGDSVAVGYPSNFADDRVWSWVYFASTLDAAIWGAELARGDNNQRIYIVEPTGAFVDDPNLTDKKFSGNPTMSYRSKYPLRVIAEVVDWTGHPIELVQQMKDHLTKLRAEGRDCVID
jgi:rifampin ADP-ribosylating transferase